MNRQPWEGLAEDEGFLLKEGFACVNPRLEETYCINILQVLRNPAVKKLGLILWTLAFPRLP